jgi:hypothetical protein
LTITTLPPGKRGAAYGSTFFNGMPTGRDVQFTNIHKDLNLLAMKDRWEDNIKIDIKWGGRVWTAFTWLRIRSYDGLL